MAPATVCAVPDHMAAKGPTEGGEAMDLEAAASYLVALGVPLWLAGEYVVHAWKAPRLLGRQGQGPRRGPEPGSETRSPGTHERLRGLSPICLAAARRRISPRLLRWPGTASGSDPA